MNPVSWPYVTDARDADDAERAEAEFKAGFAPVDGCVPSSAKGCRSKDCCLPTSQFSRVPQMAVNGAQICDLE